MSRVEGHRRHRGRTTLLALAALVGLAVAGAVVYAWSLPPQVPANTYLAGVPVGGLDADHLATVLTTQVRARVELPLTVTVGSDHFTLAASQLGVRLDVAGTARQLLRPTSLRDRWWPGRRARHDVTPQVTMVPATAQAALAAQLKDVGHDPVDASVDLPAPTSALESQGNVTYRPTSVRGDVHPGRAGEKVDMDTAATVIRAAVARGLRQVTVRVTRVQPRVTAAALGRVDQVIGTFTTHHQCCEPRVTNIHRIAELVDGTMVLPGATFSLNRASGRRTAANGFVAAPAISDGELVQQFGGGVSQFSTTLFNATWFSGLPTLKHQPHSKYISRYPPGREATLDFDTIDQVFRNDTDTPVVIRTATTGTSVTVALYGHTGDRSVTSRTGDRVQRNGGGFSIVVQRTVRQDGRVTGTDTLNWTYTGFD